MSTTDRGPGIDRERLLAEAELDQADAAILDAVHALFDDVDPVPDGLVERIQFELTLDALHAEVATLTMLDLTTSGARGTTTEAARTITFTAESLTTMVTITAQPDGRVRVDGWAAPGAGLLVEVLHAEGSLRAYADEDGRFVLEQVPPGLARFALHTLDATGVTHTVMSPTIEL